MVYNLIKKIYLTKILNSKLIKRFILKSYNNLKLDDNLKSHHIDLIENRFSNTNLTALIYEDIVKKNISSGKYNNIYILTDIDYKINTKFVNHLKIINIKSIFDLKKDEIKNSLFFVLFSSDDVVLPQIEEII